MWNARTILKDIADAERRRRVLSAFWRHGEMQAKLMAQMQLAKALHFREETIRKMPPDKKADLLASRLASPEFEQTLEMALMQYHTEEQKTLLAAFLDHWQIPHENGSIEADEYPTPTTEQVRDAVKTLTNFDARDVALYLATAGLLMGEDWRESTTPVVDEILKTVQPGPSAD
ncbi:MAG TPA: hypothetical protein VFN10_02400 [Thermoanaerobaculia bacterium]|nr:hypothetical protein [Thermoanaerobaculia bacterium]